ncbi:badF/BadG/BcrA/BcrD ATPase family protein [Brevibacillus laterosporus GI-9]|uniref:BadF/BadG/BcrA/BcrD ATPase family protein n=1 Tax=Brevibacillus laterosporus TaxID=1465 RepID=UPI0002404AA3|nr:BadF/BadG/BcrA/BcrD ATPase family protein [Brevibacillus laterosporus]CCF13134.1 badF/BadG/BcrA/BcrD ATPase family protein [Brevibacillus laterosporus GI-9]
MAYIIGVDGGGTKTIAVAYNFQGAELARAESGYGNVLVHRETAIAHIIKAIEQCQSAIVDDCECAYLFLGLAGIQSGTHREVVETSLQERFGIPLTITNDARIAHAACLQGQDGILTIAGTGAVALGVHQGQSLMTGGWGHLLGDEGSGYWIGIEALRQLILEEECGLESSSLGQRLVEYLKIQKTAQIKDFVYSSSKDKIAALTPLVVKEAEAGEPNAQRILQRAGEHLAQITIRLYHKFRFEPPVSIALKGSVLTKIALVQEAFYEEVKNAIPDPVFVIDETCSSKGAYYLALQAMNEQKR